MFFLDAGDPKYSIYFKFLLPAGGNILLYFSRRSFSIVSHPASYNSSAIFTLGLTSICVEGSLGRQIDGPYCWDG